MHALVQVDKPKLRMAHYTSHNLFGDENKRITLLIVELILEQDPGCFSAARSICQLEVIIKLCADGTGRKPNEKSQQTSMTAVRARRH